MSRTSRLVWLVPAVILVWLALWVDPFGRPAGPPEAVSIAPPPAESTAPPEVPAVELAGGDADPILAPDLAPEREAAEPVSEEGMASIRVLRTTGDPVVGAQVLAWREGALLGDERTDEHGRVELPADGQPAALFVAEPSRALERHEVVLTEGDHRIVLSAEGVLRGRIVHENGSSPEAQRLALASDHPPTAVGRVPEIVAESLVPYVLWQGYSLVRIDADGAFEVVGLPPSWSGRLLMRRAGRVVSTTHGAILPAGEGVRIDHPVADLVIRVAPRGTLSGRLVQPDGNPVDGARVAARLLSPAAHEPTHSSATTDEEGRFEFTLRQSGLSEVELRLGVRFSESAPLLRLGAEALPPDGDLGDITVDDLHHVPFLLQDGAGVAIRGGQGIAAGARSPRTDEGGRSELRWLSRSVDRLVAVAKGYVPTTAEIPPVVLDPIRVTMDEATELTVQLLLPEDSDPGQFKVLLRGEERITASPVESSAAQSRHVSARGIHFFDFTGEPKDRYLCSNVDSARKTVFHALRPGVETHLEVQGITGQEVYHAETVTPLAAGEHRTIEISLETGLVTFRGFVLDEDGDPLGHATVQLGGSILDFTEDDGSFECLLPGPESGTLLLQHSTCSTLFLHDYVVPVDGEAVEFRLSPARPLTIEVVDVNGAPVPQAEVYTEHGGFTTTTRRLEGARHFSSSMPGEPFVIRVDLAGRSYRQEHDPFIDEARVVVPVHGSVVALVGPESTAARAGRFTLTLQAQDTTGARPVAASRDAASDLRIEMSAVHPGSYDAVLGYEPTEAERAAGHTPSSSATVATVVVAGEETRVHLALPAGGD